MEFYGLLAVSMLEEQKMFLNAQWNAMEVNFVQKSYIVTFCYSLTCLPGSITKMFHVPSGICTYILYHSAILVLWNGMVVDYCLFSCCLYILRVIIVYISTYARHLDLAETESITITSLSLCSLWATTLKLFIRWLWILIPIWNVPCHYIFKRFLAIIYVHVSYTGIRCCYLAMYGILLVLWNDIYYFS